VTIRQSHKNLVNVHVSHSQQTENQSHTDGSQSMLVSLLELQLSDLHVEICMIHPWKSVKYRNKIMNKV